MVLVLLGACSLGRVDWTPCTDNEGCRLAFGFGHVCGGDGLCTDAPRHNRCTRTFPADLLDRPEEYPDPVLIGTLLDQSTDIPETQASELAIRQVTDRGGLDGRPVVAVECTYEEDPRLDGATADEAAVATALYLSDTLGAPAIVGPATSAQSEVAYTAVDETAGLSTLFISPSATSPALTSLDGVAHDDAHPGLWWRTAPPDSLQGRVMAADMVERGATRVAAIYEEGPYGEGLVEVFVEAFAVDGRTVDRRLYADDATRDAAIQEVGNGAYDEVLFVAAEVEQMDAFLNGAAEIGGYADLPVFLGDGARDVQLVAGLTSGWDLVDQVRGTNPAQAQGDVYEAFAAAYAAAYGDSAGDSSYSAHAYDATWLALYGATWATYREGGVTGPGMAAGLRRISDPTFGEPIPIGSTTWTDIGAWFAEGRRVDVIGASGELDYDPVTEETSAPIDVWTIAPDGTFVTAYTTPP